MTRTRTLFILILVSLVIGVAMPRGTPDGKLSQFAYAADETDIGKTTAALFGFSPIDGAGRIIYFDSWKNGIGAWKKVTSGVGAVAASLVDESTVTSGEIYSPPKTARINPGTTLNALSRIAREMYLGRVGIIGVETSFYFVTNSPTYTLNIDYNPVEKSPKFAYVKFDRTLNQWLIYTKISGVNAFTNVFSYTPPTNSMHVPVKLVADFNTGYYVRLLIGDQLIDIQQYEIGDSSSTAEGYCIFAVGSISQGAGTVAGYAGYFLATKDETESGYTPPPPPPPVPSLDYNIKYFIMSGGGGSGNAENSAGASGGGGGGAGGNLSSLSYPITPGVLYNVVIGAGGPAATIGTPSSFNGISPVGGGSGATGAAGANNPGGNGGSGGGGGRLGIGGTGTVGQGNNGSAAVGINGGAGGGVGGAAAGNTGGIGIVYDGVTYGVGGDGGLGNSGGGNGVAGTANRGNGAKGATGGGAGGVGAAGGSGIVILTIPTINYSAIYTGAPVITVVGADTILTFNANGSYTG